MDIAERAARMPRSGIRHIAELAWAQPGTVRLELGEPSLPTPDHIVEAAVRAARDGHTHYTQTAGIPELRDALAEKVNRINGVGAQPSNMVVTSGSGQGIFATLSCLVGQGDEILVPDPGWPNYRMMSVLLGARAVGYALSPELGYQPDLAQLAAAVGDRTRVILINSPSNPLGTMLSDDTMAGILDIARRHDLWILSDECYDQVVLEGTHTAFGSLEERPERVVSAWSLSKTYAMTGWRVGYLHAPDCLIDTLRKVQEPLVACVNAPAQHAALAAITGPQQFVTDAVVQYRARADLAFTTLRDAGLAPTRTAATFYSWLTLPAGRDGDDTARDLLLDHGVAVAPGETFGDNGRHAIRISLAGSEDDLGEGLRRICAGLRTR